MKTKRRIGGIALLLTTGLLPPSGVHAQESDRNFLGLDLRGSLGVGRHSRYVPPLTNPVLNETPYITTEARAIYLHQELPDGFVTGGGNIDLVALQARLALTERLAFIATKDGYADIDFDGALPDEDGAANIALGFKYAVFSQPETESILTAGIRYEIPIEDLETAGIELQGAGDGFLNPFISGATTLGNLGIQASAGANIALDQKKDTSFFHYSLHLDYEALPGLFPIVELNGFTAFNNGSGLTGPLGDLDGGDLVSFGSDDRDTSVTFGGGLRYRLMDHLQLGVGAETPIVTDVENDNIMDWRIYADLVLTYF